MTEIPLRIMLAHAEAVTSALLQGLIESGGHQLSVVSDGGQLVARIKQGGYDAAILDLALPVLDGFAAVGCIRALAPPEGRIWLFALSGDHHPESVAQLRAAGFDAVIGQPIDPQNLLSLLRQAVPAAGPEMAGMAQNPPGPAPALDVSVLVGLEAALGRDRLERVALAFVNLAPRTIASLDEALLNRDLKSLRRAAHSLAGSSGSLGLVETERLARAVMAGADQGELSPVMTGITALLAALENGVVCLQVWLKDGAGGSDLGEGRRVQPL